jgi:apolipoprotein N-acyltransferase
VLTAALPPLHAIAVAVPAFVGLLWLVDGSRGWRGAFGAGWWFGLGYFAAGLYWIAFALLTDAARFGWLVPIAVFGMAAGLAIFSALATLALWFVGARGVARVVALAVLWTAAEYARGNVLTGFPWNLIGQAWSFSDAFIQVTSFSGVYGLGFLTVLAAALPALWWEGARPSSRWLGLAAPLAIVAALWLGGTLRLATAEPSSVPGVTLRLVQPDIRQADKWKPGLRDQHLAKMMAMTAAPASPPVTHVIWPEAAIPFFIGQDVVRREAIGRIVPPGGLLLTGAPRTDPDARGGRRIWNALQVIDRNGAIAATYDKFHLVPFGEYVPLRGILPIEKITAGVGDFSAGPGVRTLSVPGLPPFSPLICYEGIFPGAVADRRDRPAWLLNLTNDAWFGISAGPHQHFAAVRLRAVEEGLPLVRAANNGISAVVDPYGRIVARLGLGREGILDAALPMALPGATFYARYGDLILIVIFLISAIIICISAIVGRRAEPPTGD